MWLFCIGLLMSKGQCSPAPSEACLVHWAALLAHHPPAPLPLLPQAAYEIYKNSGGAFSLVLMDCRMPVMDGWQVGGNTGGALHIFVKPSHPFWLGRAATRAPRAA